MRQEHVPKLKVDLDEVNERSRKEIMKTIESYGLRPVSDLEKMSDGDRTKWLFWNMHENLDALRKREPALIGQIIRSQLTVSDGLSIWQLALALCNCGLISSHNPCVIHP